MPNASPGPLARNPLPVRAMNGTLSATTFPFTITIGLGRLGRPSVLDMRRVRRLTRAQGRAHAVSVDTAGQNHTVARERVAVCWRTLVSCSATVRDPVAGDGVVLTMRIDRHVIGAALVAFTARA